MMNVIQRFILHNHTDFLKQLRTLQIISTSSTIFFFKKLYDLLKLKSLDDALHQKKSMGNVVRHFAHDLGSSREFHN